MQSRKRKININAREIREDRPVNGYSIVISGLTEEEVRKLSQDFGRGNQWVRVGHNNRLVYADTIHEAPTPMEDPLLAPYWPRVKANRQPVQMALFDHDSVRPMGSPKILIKSLCWDNVSLESYANQATLLESFGFECLRGRRTGKDERFTEVWLLNDLWAAQGELGETLNEGGIHTKQSGTNKACLDRAIAFLARRISFAELDVSLQRATFTVI